MNVFSFPVHGACLNFKMGNFTSLSSITTGLLKVIEPPILLGGEQMQIVH